jgi:predicted dehydrogenase
LAYLKKASRVEEGKPMKVGLIGTGFGTKVHMPAMRADKHIEVVAICSAQRARAEAAAKKWEVEYATDDYRELIARDDVELVDICTTPASHAEMTIAALEAGKDVLCEKPLAMSRAEARAMTAAADAARRERSGLVDAVHHELRYLPYRRLLRDLVRSGYLGDLRYVLASAPVDYGVNPSMEPYWFTWVARKEQGGGCLTGMLSHEIDLLRYTVGDLHEVYGTVSIAVPEKPVLAWDYRDGDKIGPDSPSVGTMPATADDTAVITGRLENGAPFVLTGTWAVFNGSGSRIEVYGSEATAIVHNGVVRAARHGQALADMRVPSEYTLEPSTGDRNVPPSTRLFEELAAVVDGRRSVSEALFARIADGMRVQEIMDIAREKGERIIGL